MNGDEDEKDDKVGEAASSREENSKNGTLKGKGTMSLAQRDKERGKADIVLYKGSNNNENNEQYCVMISNFEACGTLMSNLLKKSGELL